MQQIENSVEKVAADWRNEPYYDRAEQQDWLGGFWDRENSRYPFMRLLETMNLNVTVELAVGHGRHAAQIADKVPALILMDVVAENIDYCRRRFAGLSNVVCVQNSGANFQPLPDASVSAIFCYDAMVHFEFDVVLSYIQDTTRVLQSGGRALYHHSNLSAYPGGDHKKSPGGRNFMSQALFIHAARRAGLEIVESIPMDWDQPFTDCLTLLQKP